MILNNQKNVEEEIISILGEKGWLSAKKIYEILQKSNQPVSIQSVYKSLGKMEEVGIIVKNKKNYTLQMSWILDIYSHIKEIRDNYFEKNYYQSVLPEKEIIKKTWIFNDLMEAADFWGQILIVMAKKFDKPIALSYSPYLWFDLAMTSKDHQFLKSYHDVLEKEYVIIGNKSQIDRERLVKVESKKEKLFFLDKPSEIFVNHLDHADIINDLVLSIKLDKTTNDAIREIYEKEYNQKQVPIGMVFDLFTRKTKVKIILKKDRRKANYYYKKFSDIFGPIK